MFLHSMPYVESKGIKQLTPDSDVSYLIQNPVLLKGHHLKNHKIHKLGQLVQIGILKEF